MTRIGLVLSVSILVSSAATVEAGAGHDHGRRRPAAHDARDVVDVRGRARVQTKALRRQREAAPRGVTVFLNRHGAQLSPGWDDAASGVSSIVERRTRIPAFAGGDRKWHALVACVQQQFAPFAVEITDARPASGDYVMALVGGESHLVGADDDVAGIAPWTGEVLRNAVVFTFSDTIGDDPEHHCQTTSHEIGHALGLDHAVACSDVMSYEDCGEKAFRDLDAACGEWEERACERGGTQNSYRHLATAVGLRDEDAAAPRPLPPNPAPIAPAPIDPYGDDEGDDEPSADEASGDGGDWVWDGGDWVWADDEGDDTVPSIVPAAPELDDDGEAFDAAELVELARLLGFRDVESLIAWIEEL